MPQTAGESPADEPVVRRTSPYRRDSAGYGTLIGALVGAGTGMALLGVAYSMCDRYCDAPARLPMFSMAAMYGGGIGALTGWLADRLHKGKDVVYPVPPSRLKTNNTAAAR